MVFWKWEIFLSKQKIWREKIYLAKKFFNLAKKVSKEARPDPESIFFDPVPEPEPKLKIFNYFILRKLEILKFLR